uniref:Glyco_hydro_2_C domain-containing protein n=1 Tax=Gongylonema pulchrum TaxID=637853 RepID=A0A183DKB0_9BILA
LLEQTHIAFDLMRSRHKLAGEMIWNFIDFMTDQTVSRVVGNHKGMLTRNRQPKMAAYVIKQRYENLEKQMNAEMRQAEEQQAQEQQTTEQQAEEQQAELNWSTRMLTFSSS